MNANHYAVVAVADLIVAEGMLNPLDEHIRYRFGPAFKQVEMGELRKALVAAFVRSKRMAEAVRLSKFADQHGRAK